MGAEAEESPGADWEASRREELMHAALEASPKWEASDAGWGASGNRDGGSC